MSNVDVSPNLRNINSSFYTCMNTRRQHSPGIFYGESPLKFSFTILMLELVFLVSITRIIRFVLKPLKQPRFVSDILGGIVVGPSLLGRNKSFVKHLFPPNAVFVIRNLGMINFVYYFFLAGVKMDLTLARKASRKTLTFAATVFLIPFLIGIFISFSIRKSMDKELAKPQIFGAVSCILAITSFPVIEQTIGELNLLSSEVGRLALATVITTDIAGINCVLIFEALRQYNFSPIYGLWALLSAIVLSSVAVTCRHIFVWIVKTTPEGKPVSEVYVIMILVSAFIASFCTDVTGLNMAIGPFWLGIVVPTGPPLGATLVEKAETITNEFLMPFGFAFLGMTTDLTTLSGSWDLMWPLLVLVVALHVAKFVTVYGVSRFYGMPVKDSLAFAFVMEVRGQLDLVQYLHWVVVQVVPVPSFAMLVLSAMVVTAISGPMISILYDPTRPYMVNKRRAVQYTALDTELSILVCIHDQESVAGFINLLEVSDPTVHNKFTVFALRLIELVGRAHPVFIDHENQVEAFELSGYNRIHNALTVYQESVGEHVKCHYFTSVSPKRTMYQDICKLALTKKATIIIMPYKTESLDGRTEVVRHGMLHTATTNVLTHAPCSVGILVDPTCPFPTHRANYSGPGEPYRVAVLYMGGPDAREALAYADRMVSNPNLTLTVVRFLSRDSVGDDPMEKKLDDGLITMFWVKNEGNDRVVYREATVSDGAETVGAIQAMMGDYFFDMWMVGRKNGINQVLVQGLSSWSKRDELGVIGDYIVSVEPATTVLVVQQQVLRGQDGRK